MECLCYHSKSLERVLQTSLGILWRINRTGAQHYALWELAISEMPIFPGGLVYNAFIRAFIHCVQFCIHGDVLCNQIPRGS